MTSTEASSGSAASWKERKWKHRPLACAARSMDAVAGPACNGHSPRIAYTVHSTVHSTPQYTNSFPLSRRFGRCESTRSVGSTVAHRWWCHVQGIREQWQKLVTRAGKEGSRSFHNQEEMATTRAIRAFLHSHCGKHLIALSHTSKILLKTLC